LGAKAEMRGGSFFLENVGESRFIILRRKIGARTRYNTLHWLI
jgi:hypothetical protein